MTNEHKRICELADGWQGSEAYVSLSPADALVLTDLGAAVEPGNLPTAPSRIKGTALFEAAEGIRSADESEKDAAAPAGGEGTPNQRSVGTPQVGPVDPANRPGPGVEPGTVNLNPDAAGSDPVGPAPAAAATAEPEQDLDGLTVAELRDLADREGHDLTGQTHKADIVKAVRSGRRKAARGK